MLAHQLPPATSTRHCDPVARVAHGLTALWQPLCPEILARLKALGRVSGLGQNRTCCFAEQAAEHWPGTDYDAIHTFTQNMHNIHT